MTEYRPRLYRLSSPRDRADFEQLKARQDGLQLVDTLDEQLAELAEIRHPADPGASDVAPKPGPHDGVWAYYPWRNTAVRVLPLAEYAALRSSRNQLLITPDEQAAFANIRVAVAGLNVGNPAAICLALEGGAQAMRFADFDTLSLTNLNRFRAGLPDIGLNKAVLSARQVYELNPYAEIDVWDMGLSPQNQQDFLNDIDILIEEMDNLPLKLSLRAVARERGIPVVMVTGNGANVVLDIERYDQDQAIRPLNGLIPQHVLDAVTQPPPKALRDRAGLARDFMGPGVLTERLLKSFDEVGRQLVGIPQLAESSFMRGAVACHAVRTIATGGPAHSGRYHIKLDEVFT